MSLGSPSVHADPITTATPNEGVGVGSAKGSGSTDKDARGDPLQTVREYQRAAETNPSESNFFNWGAELLLHRAIEPAIEVFTRGNRLFPQSSRMLVGLGVAWYASGSNEHAAQRLCEASDLNPATQIRICFWERSKEQRPPSLRDWSRGLSDLPASSRKMPWPIITMRSVSGSEGKAPTTQLLPHRWKRC